MGRDILITVILDGALTALTCGYLWLTSRVSTGSSSIPAALLLALLGLACTAVAGARIRRIGVGIAGVVVFWIACVALDLSTSAASFAGAATAALICASVQLAVLACAWWSTG